MPNTSSAIKALRQSKTRRVFNIRKKRALKDVLKRFEKAVVAKDLKEAQNILPQVQKALDKAVKSHITNRNAASRKKSRLTAQLKKIA